MTADRKAYRDQLRATDIVTLRMIERALDRDARRTQSNLALLRRELKRRKKLKKKTDVCRNCGTAMEPGIAMQQTYTAGSPDMGECVTFSPGGPASLVTLATCRPTRGKSDLASPEARRHDDQ